MRKLDIDTALVKRFKRGDRDAFNEIWRRHQRKLFGAIMRIIHDPFTAEDLLQEAAISALQHIGEWEGKGALTSWLYRIAVNCALMHLRAVKHKWKLVDHRYDVFFNAIPANLPDAQKTLEAREDLRLVERAFNRVPKKHRNYTELNIVWGYTADEIAKGDGIRLPAVKSVIHRGRRQWARFIEMEEKGMFKKVGNL
jgi:RNA polymerase sigma-70 factor (ECF subfamily)